MAVTRDTSEFFKKDLPSYASYDNQRKIASSIDGLKISMRKIIFTLMEKYPGKEKTKTDTVANVCAAYTNYLHGAGNLGGVCDTMAQSFVGANNYPLIEGNSSGFGTRINPTCAASRYTKVALSPLLESLLDKNDLEIVGRQFFEGSYIEPRFFVPVFPMLFLNGSHGISSGFSQDIYPRNPKEVIKYINNKLDNKNSKVNLLPWFRGFNGTVKHNPVTGKNECWGVVTQNNMNNYTITELPIGMEYQKYIETLDKLCDNNVIVDYEDLCDTKTDNIKFDIKTTREFTRTYDTEEKLYTALKLIKTLPETLCCIDETNRVIEYNSVDEILDHYIQVRLSYYSDRKDYILKETEKKINLLNSKYEFCKAIVDGNLTIMNVKKADIIKSLEAMPKIIKVDDSYNYLLNMPMHSVSQETLKQLQSSVKEQKDYYKTVKNTTINDMWKSDLTKVEANI